MTNWLLPFYGNKKQQQQQQAESEISTRNAGKSSLNDIFTSGRRQSIDLDWNTTVQTTDLQ